MGFGMKHEMFLEANKTLDAIHKVDDNWHVYAGIKSLLEQCEDIIGKYGSVSDRPPSFQISIGVGVLDNVNQYLRSFSGKSSNFRDLIAILVAKINLFLSWEEIVCLNGELAGQPFGSKGGFMKSAGTQTPSH